MRMRKKLNPKVLGLMEKLWGTLPCAHGHEGVTPVVKLPKIGEIKKSPKNKQL